MVQLLSTTLQFQLAMRGSGADSKHPPLLEDVQKEEEQLKASEI